MTWAGTVLTTVVLTLCCTDEGTTAIKYFPVPDRVKVADEVRIRTFSMWVSVRPRWAVSILTEYPEPQSLHAPPRDINLLGVVAVDTQTGQARFASLPAGTGAWKWYGDISGNRCRLAFESSAERPPTVLDWELHTDDVSHTVGQPLNVTPLTRLLSLPEVRVFAASENDERRFLIQSNRLRFVLPVKPPLQAFRRNEFIKGNACDERFAFGPLGSGNGLVVFQGKSGPGIDGSFSSGSLTAYSLVHDPIKRWTVALSAICSADEEALEVIPVDTMWTESDRVIWQVTLREKDKTVGRLVELDSETGRPVILGELPAAGFSLRRLRESRPFLASDGETVVILSKDQNSIRRFSIRKKAIETDLPMHGHIVRDIVGVTRSGKVIVDSHPGRLLAVDLDAEPVLRVKPLAELLIHENQLE
jgi:hypothetical protein